MQQVLIVIAASAAVWLCTCTSINEKQKLFAKTSLSRITRLDVEAFSAVARFMPGVHGHFKLLGQDHVAGVLETEALYNKARWKPAYFFIRYSRQWRWKRRYFIARMYSVEVLQKKLGFSDAEIKRYYNSHKAEFTRNGDTAAPVLPFDSVWFGAARKLFLSTFQPDSGAPDLRLSGEFYRFLTEGYEDYFLKKFYRERFGETPPQSFDALLSSSGMVTKKDLKAATILLAPQERKPFEKDPGPFVRSLVKWKLFSERAARSGFLAKPEVMKTLAWAWKIEVAQRFLDECLIRIIQEPVPVDTGLELLSYYDEAGHVEAAVDSQKWNSHMARLAQEAVTVRYDSLMFPLRRALRVRFVQNEWIDEKGKDPVALKRRADSLRDAGNETEAYTAYSIIAANYIFTSAGCRSLCVLASIQAEKPDSRPEAIKNYRRVLRRTRDKNLQSKALFAVGFIYDRYLNKPDLAKINYQRLIHTLPDHPLAKDAKVMLRYLGKPMPGKEELLNQKAGGNERYIGKELER
ncbi:MAG: hypothetical protein JW768_16590 [Chitinispirillaceae bacterium]|nr:hypothetical protein [Chitinispirillaceae bacterium]